MLSRLCSECNSLNCGEDNHIDPTKNVYHIQNHIGLHNETSDINDATNSTIDPLFNGSEVEQIRPGYPETMHNFSANNVPNENMNMITPPSLSDLKFQRR